MLCCRFAPAFAPALTSLSLTSLTPNLLTQPSFDRASPPSSPMTLETYCRFRAYSSLYSQSPNPSLLREVKTQFALSVGSKILTLLNVSPPSSPPNLDSCTSTLVKALDKLKDDGLLARATLSDISEESREDFTDGLDLSLSVAVDTDIFQNSTILLNEQGYRLFTPSITTFLIQSIISLFLTPFFTACSIPQALMPNPRAHRHVPGCFQT